MTFDEIITGPDQYECAKARATIARAAAEVESRLGLVMEFRLEQRPAYDVENERARWMVLEDTYIPWA